MQTVAENRFTVTKELFQEGMKGIIKLEYTPTVKKLVVVLAAAWLALTAFTLWRGGHVVTLIIELVAMSAACLYVAVLIPRSRIKKGWKALLERSGDSMERVTRFYEDRMEVESGASEPLIINYEDVTRTFETAHLLILQNTEKLGVMAALDGFTKGGRDDVLALVREWSR